MERSQFSYNLYEDHNFSSDRSSVQPQYLNVSKIVVPNPSTFFTNSADPHKATDSLPPILSEKPQPHYMPIEYLTIVRRFSPTYTLGSSDIWPNPTDNISSACARYSYVEEKFTIYVVKVVIYNGTSNFSTHIFPSPNPRQWQPQGTWSRSTMMSDFSACHTDYSLVNKYLLAWRICPPLINSPTSPKKKENTLPMESTCSLHSYPRSKPRMESPYQYIP